MTLLPGYFEHTIDTVFISKKMFYCMYIPMQMSKYNQLKSECSEQQIPTNWEIGMIEQGCFFGFGKIGLSHPSGDWKVQGKFIAYKLVGDYNQMKTIYPKIKKDYPNSCNFYNLYLTDPNHTKMEENITYILFQVQE